MLFWARRLGAGRIAVSERCRAEMARERGFDAVIDQSNMRTYRRMTDALDDRPTRPRSDRSQRGHDRGGACQVTRRCRRARRITLDEMTIRPASLCLKETDLVFPIILVPANGGRSARRLARGDCRPGASYHRIAN
jgi:hypothetical protein